MAQAPLPEDRVVFSPVGIQRGAQTQTDVSPLVGVLSNWAHNRRTEVEHEAIDRMRATATKQQSALGVQGLAETPEGVRGQFADAFQQQSRAVYNARLNLDATRTVRNLAQEHQDDPAGFSEAWNAYMLGQVDPLQNEPDFAEQTRVGLEQVGMKALFDLEDHAAGVAQTQAKAETLANWADWRAEFSDMLNHSGDEELMNLGVADGLMRLDEMFESGILTPDQYVRERTDLRNRAAQEVSFGAFRQALDAGDVAGMEAIIDRTDRGVLFDDNPMGRTTASNLTTRMRDMLRQGEEAAGKLVSFHMGTISSFQELAQRGRLTDLDHPALAHAFQQIEIYGTPNQIAELDRTRQGLELQVAVRPDLVAIPPAVLAQYREFVENNPQAFPRGDIGQVLDVIDEISAERADARFTGDFLKLADLPVGASVEERERGRRVAASGANVPLEFVSHYSRAEIRRFSSEFESALDTADAPRAVGLIERFFEPVGDNIGDRMGLAQQSGVPEFSAIASVAALAGPENAVMLVERARQGRNVSGDDRRDIRVPENDIAKQAEMASLGDPDIRNEIVGLLTNAFIGEAFDRGDTKATRRGISPHTWFRQSDTGRAFSALSERLDADPVTLPNGAQVPNDFFSPSARARTFTERELSGFMTPENLGVPADAPWLYDTVRPVRLPDGGVVFFSTAAPNEFLPDPADPTQFLTFGLAERIERDFDPEAPQGFWERMGGKAQQAADSVEHHMSFGGLTNQTFPAAAQVTGTHPDTLIALRLTYDQTPVEERGSRQPTSLLSPATLESLDREDYNRRYLTMRASQGNLSVTDALQGARGTAPDPMHSVDGAAVASGMLLKQFNDKYKDADKALAAYWLGEAAMDEVIRLYGPNWRDGLPDRAEQFIYRVNHHRERVK